MRKKKSLNRILDDLDKLKRFDKNDEASKELLAKIEAKRREEGYISEYDCLLELGVIKEVVVPKNAVNLFPYIQKKRQLVNEAMKDPDTKKKVEAMQAEFKKASKL